MAGGRPRTLHPISIEDCETLGKELVEWVKVEDKENPRMFFSEFYSIEKQILRNDWKGILQRPEFLPYYQIACSYLTKRCVNGSVKEGFGHRLIRMYSRDLTDDENDKVKHDAMARATALIAESSHESLVDLLEKLSKDKVKQK